MGSIIQKEQVENKISENTVFNNIEIWPNSFENKDIFSKEEKELMREIKRSRGEGIYVSGVNPVGKGKVSRISYFISQQYGLTTFSIVSVNKEYLKNYLGLLLEMNEELEEKLVLRLLDSAALIERKDNKKSLNINFNHYIVFQNINYSSLKINERKKLQENKDKLLFKNFKDLDGVDFQKKCNNISELTEIKIKSIIERLSPEYAIVLNEKEKISNQNNNLYLKRNIKNIDVDISGDELEYKTFALDSQQINLVNEISYGHRLILANPGAGKSVILLAKAFRMCKIYENEKVLLTCYNNNLVKAYKFRNACSGYDTENLYISTFHKLVLDLVHDILKKKYSILDFDKALDDLENAIDKNIITLRFKAIFIDEVQVFEARWLNICYKLLEKDDTNIFLMAGDINQDLKNNSKKGKAVWQLATEIPSNFRGRVKYISKNYRNKKEICDYINKQLKYMNTKYTEMGLNNLNDFEVGTTGESESIGGKIELSLGNNKFNFKEDLRKKIKELILNEKVEPSDIAIIIPYKQHKAFKYYPLSWIRTMLEEEGINYRVICNESGGANKNSNEEGVIISTIDSALGLDFNTVILTGLYPMQYVKTGERFVLVKSWKELSEMKDEEKISYMSNFRKIYTACSRARERLCLLSDLNTSTPINKFIKMES